ncbi:MAG TPA: penicillin-binding protein [Candidatus Avipropionibacterium avicola]|uniref:Penicillin-binding protein n=1 Tax=Candidatus Avipropionibacterium avicola TaxID=2840701 RepID=A0A9D1KL51_9ACTN|nr:penicillin-binding protein [Candidatus Avipropionibacterium avicola]
MPVTPKRVGGVLYSALMFVAVSALSGVLIAGLFVPFAGMASATGRATVDEMEQLPVELDVPAQAERSTVLLGNGEVLTYFYDENRSYVPLEDIAPIMQAAQIAIEDHRFYEHGAFDPMTTLKSLVRREASGASGGGSSITQQYVKMVRIEHAALNGDIKGVQQAQEATYARKIQELRYAIALEQKLSKDEILERYLNIAYYGHGAYGVEAAAQTYFGVSAKKLTLAQGAMLAGLVQNPDQVNPVTAERLALERRDTVINRMAQLGLVSQKEADKAKKTGFNRKKVQRSKNGCEGSQYPFLCQYVQNTLLESPELGKTVEERKHMLNRGGLTIKTKIDTKTQDAAQKALSNVVSPTDPVISVINIVEPGTGLILAMAQSRPEMGNDTKKGETYWNYSVSPSLGGAEGYQAGSTFKAFALVAALENGVPMDQRYPAPQTKDFGSYTWQTCDGPRKLTGSWKVSNSTGWAPSMTLQQATAKSTNTYFVQLEHRAGVCNTAKAAERTGVELTTPGDSFDDWGVKPSFVLGTPEIAPLSLAEAYATFAARGIHCDAHIVDSITKPNGKKLKVSDGECKRVMKQEVADGVNKLLHGVMSGTGSRATIPGGYPQAGKTGTTEENQAVWFAGYTPEVAGIAMIAKDKTASVFKKDSSGKAERNGIKGLTLKTGFYLEGSGGGDAGARLYTPAMAAALDGRPKTDFVEPPKVITEPKQVEVPSVSGLSVQQATEKLTGAGFMVYTRRSYNSAPAGTFLGISPGPGSKVDQGSDIYINISAGPAPKKEEPKKDDKDDDKKDDDKKDDDKKDDGKKDDNDRGGDNGGRRPR